MISTVIIGLGPSCRFSLTSVFKLNWTPKSVLSTFGSNSVGDMNSELIDYNEPEEIDLKEHINLKITW